MGRGSWEILELLNEHNGPRRASPKSDVPLSQIGAETPDANLLIDAIIDAENRQLYPLFTGLPSELLGQQLLERIDFDPESLRVPLAVQL